MTAPIGPVPFPERPSLSSARKSPEEAAKQFESLLIAQMLRSARESGMDDAQDSQSSATFEIAEQQFAVLLARNGGLGLARLILRGFEHASNP